MSKYNDITIHQTLSASTQERRVLLSCGGRYYEASPAIAELVEELQSHDTEGGAIAAYVEKKAGKYTPEQVRQIIDKFITPLFAPTETKRSFLYEKELFTAQAIDRFSDRFSFLCVTGIPAKRRNRDGRAGGNGTSAGLFVVMKQMIRLT